jgi:hypothetical protein
VNGWTGEPAVSASHRRLAAGYRRMHDTAESHSLRERRPEREEPMVRPAVRVRDTVESAPAGSPGTSWLLLIHQIAPEPAYLRVKVSRRLRQLGAVTVKNTVYLLPGSAETREDFEWVAREIRQDGGSALVCATEFVSGLAEEEAREMFRRDRDDDYRGILEEAQTLARECDATASAQRQYARLLEKLEATVAIDYFGAPERAQVEAAVHAVGTRFGPKPDRLERHVGDLTGRKWVTRADVHVDRMASAWLIRRFIDPQARFHFVHERDYVHTAEEIRFDMFEGEFTHVGDRCTFEVIRERVVPDHPALSEIAEFVHDIDLKDQKFGRPETIGLARLIRGIQLAHADDHERIARACVLLDELYASFSESRTVESHGSEDSSRKGRRR